MDGDRVVVGGDKLSEGIVLPLFLIYQEGKSDLCHMLIYNLNKCMGSSDHRQNLLRLTHPCSSLR